jgi:hypothetical protein
MKNRLSSLLIISLLIYGCEKNPYFQSESTVAKKIQKRWQLVLVAPGPSEDWVFTDGKVYRIGTVKIPNDTIDVGNYSVSTSISDAFLYISGFKNANYLNTKLTISTIDDNVLSILGTDATTGSGTVYREFTAKK